MTRPKVYHLYIWRIRHNGLGRLTQTRGRRVASFRRYRDLVAHARDLTSRIGYPQAQWPSLFDWNQTDAPKP